VAAGMMAVSALCFQLNAAPVWSIAKGGFNSCPRAGKRRAVYMDSGQKKSKSDCFLNVRLEKAEKKIR